MASITSRKRTSEKRLLPEKSAARTNDQSRTELIRRRRKILARLGGGLCGAPGGDVAGFGSAMRKNTGARRRALTRVRCDHSRAEVGRWFTRSQNESSVLSISTRLSKFTGFTRQGFAPR